MRQAAALAGLRPSCYVAAAALAMARQVAVDGPDAAARPGRPGRASAALTPAQDRGLFAELMRSRVAVRRFGINVNQAVAPLDSGQEPPVWLERAVAGCERAVARLDEAAPRWPAGWPEGWGVIGQVFPRGSSVRGLLYYLFTEGQAGEEGLDSAHTDRRMIASWDGAPLQLQPPVCAGGCATSPP